MKVRPTRWPSPAYCPIMLRDAAQTAGERRDPRRRRNVPNSWGKPQTQEGLTRGPCRRSVAQQRRRSGRPTPPGPWPRAGRPLFRWRAGARWEAPGPLPCFVCRWSRGRSRPRERTSSCATCGFGAFHSPARMSRQPIRWRSAPALSRPGAGERRLGGSDGLRRRASCGPAVAPAEANCGSEQRPLHSTEVGGHGAAAPWGLDGRTRRDPGFVGLSRWARPRGILRLRPRGRPVGRGPLPGLPSAETSLRIAETATVGRQRPRRGATVVLPWPDARSVDPSARLAARPAPPEGLLPARGRVAMRHALPVGGVLHPGTWKRWRDRAEQPCMSHRRDPGERVFDGDRSRTSQPSVLTWSVA
jgi:hypothetical protein